MRPTDRLRTPHLSSRLTAGDTETQCAGCRDVRHAGHLFDQTATRGVSLRVGERLPGSSSENLNAVRRKARDPMIGWIAGSAQPKGAGVMPSASELT